MKSVLSNVKAEQVKIHPFPYVFIENAIDEDICEALIREFPSNEVVAQGKSVGDNKRFSLSAPFVAQNAEISPLWKEFIAVHSSQTFLDEFISLFRPHIEAAYPHLLKKRLKSGIRNKDTFETSDVLMDAQICINSPVLGSPSSVKIGHIDDTDKLFAGLFYLRPDEDDSEGGNLEIYKTKKGTYKIHGPRLVGNNYIEPVLTVPYKKNTLILFLNTPLALHGVTVRSQTPHTRKFMNLVAEVSEPLFSLESYQENIFNKIIRKLQS